MKSLLLAFVCTLTPSAVAAETIVIPVQDMLFVCPDFDDAPDFDLNQSVNGRDFIGDKKTPKKTKTRREVERELISLIEALYPTAKVRIVGDNLIIRIP